MEPGIIIRHGLEPSGMADRLRGAMDGVHAGTRGTAGVFIGVLAGIPERNPEGMVMSTT